MPHADLNACEAVSGTYQSVGFLRLAAQALAGWAAPGSGEHVLDVATGTGEVARCAAEQVGAAGRVVGTDLSAGMVRVARGLPHPAHLTFQQADAQSLPFADATFDRVLCGAGLFFLPDMQGALREWGRVLRPGGTVALSSFSGPVLDPLPALWAADLRAAGFRPVVPPFARLQDPAQMAALLQSAGFTGAEVLAQPLDYQLAHPAQRWADIEWGLEGLPLRGLPEPERRALQAQHLRGLSPLFGEAGLTLSVPLLLARGQWPG